MTRRIGSPVSEDTLHTLEEIVRDLLIFVGAMAVLLVALIVIVSLCRRPTRSSAS